MTVQEYIESLPKTAGEIRQMVEGIKAKRLCAFECVIAEHCKQVTGIEVGVTHSYFRECETDRLYFFDKPELKEFLVNFDNGRYPELVT